MVIGITGSMGCGKSYAVNLFKKYSEKQNIESTYISIDEIRRDLLNNNEGLNSLYKQAYSSKQNMKAFKNSFLPVLKAKIEQIIFQNKDKLIFLEWALLVEDNLLSICDVIVLASCDKKTQLSPLKNGDLSLKDIKKRISLQLTNSQKLKKIKQSKIPFVVLNTSCAIDKDYKSCLEKVLSLCSDYSFCLFKIPKNGGRVLWEITNLCNYNCVYCIFNSCSKKVENELTTAQIKKVIKDLKKNNFSYIKFTGGEPFVRSDMVNILKYASKNKFQMDISTNASLITDKLAKKLSKINLKYVHVSLDGYDKNTHELVRGKNTFERTLLGIKNLVNNNVATRLGCLIYSQNQDRLEDVIKLATSLKVNEIIFSFMEPIGRLDKQSPLISNLKIEDIENTLKCLQEKYKHEIKVSYSFTKDNSKSFCKTKCPALNKFVFIDNLGYVSPCTWLVDKYPKYKSELSLKRNSYKKVVSCKNFEDLKCMLEKTNYNICPTKKR